MNPPPPDETAQWIRFGLTTLIGLPSSIIAGWLLWDKLRERPPKLRRISRELESSYSVKAPAATATASVPTPAFLDLQPSHGTSSATLTLTTGGDPILDQMAEIFPYEFPPN